MRNGDPSEFYAGSNAQANQLVFEDFHALNGPLCDIHWWGILADTSFNTPCSSGVQFTLALYKDENGQPGAKVFSQDIAATQTLEKFSILQMPIYRFDFAFDQCVEMENGWVSIQNIVYSYPDNPDCKFYWLTTGPGDGMSALQGPSGQFESKNYDLSMCLTTREIPPTVSPTPTPFTASVCDYKIPISGGVGESKISTIFDPNLAQRQCFITGAQNSAAWCFQMPSPGSPAQFTAYVSEGNPDQPIVLSLRRCCNDPATEIQCATGASKGASLNFETLEPGYYTIIASTLNPSILALNWQSQVELQSVCKDICGTDPTPTDTPYVSPLPTEVPTQEPSATPTATACADPFKPDNPYPAYGDQGIPIAPRLSWQASPTGGSGGAAPDTFFDVFIGVDPQPVKPVCIGTTETMCDPGVLEPGMTYYWRVVARNSCGETPSLVWMFTTEILPTGIPTISPTPWPTDSPTPLFTETPQATSTQGPPPGAGPCGRRTAISGMRGSSVLNTSNEPDFAKPSCYKAGMDNMTLWCFEVPEPGGFVQLTATAQAGAAPNPVVLSVRKCCNDPSSEIACAIGSPLAPGANLIFETLAPGHYTAIAQSAFAAGITLDWSAQVELLGNCGDQCGYDPCQERSSLSETQGAMIKPAKAPTAPYMPSTCNMNPTALFVASWCFTLPAAGEVVLDARGIMQDEKPLTLSLRKCCNDPYTEAICVTGSSTNGTSVTATLEAGPYTVFVELPLPAEIKLSWSSSVQLVSQCYDICRETPTPTATEPPLPTATEPPNPTATEPPLPTETKPPLPTATESPIPTATEPPLPTATATPEPTQSGPLDSDHDGFDDEYEKKHGSNPYDPSSQPANLDLNNDGQVGKDDAAILYNVLIGAQPPDPNADLSSMDFDGDGKITIRDAFIFYRNRIGKIPIVPLVPR